MKAENPELNSTISRIKEAEKEREVKDALEEIEQETVAESIKDEMEDLTLEGIKLKLEEIGINEEVKDRKEARERLTEYVGEVYEIARNYEMVYSYFEPQGADGRSFDEEIDLLLEERRKGNDYNPKFVYPELNKLDVQKLEDSLVKLDDIKKRVENEKNENVRNIVLEMISVAEAKINILLELKNNNPKGAFENAKIAYGDIDDQLCEKARECYEKRIEFFKKEQKSELEKTLEQKKFDAESIKKYFDLVLDKSQLRYANLEVVIDEKAKAIDVRFSDPDYDHPVILIPPKRVVNGIKLIQLVAHEIGCHVVQNVYNSKLGLKGLSFGRKWEIVQEGFAIRSEAEVKEEVIGESEIDLEMQAKPYYVLAMEKIKKSADLAEVYEYIFNLRKEEFLAKGCDERKSEEKASALTKNVLRRVIRGMYPYYFPKDKAYFEGEFMAREMEKEGVDKYLRHSKVDPALVPYMINLGIYSGTPLYKRSLELAKIAAGKILDDIKSKDKLIS